MFVCLLVCDGLSLISCTLYRITGLPPSLLSEGMKSLPPNDSVRGNKLLARSAMCGLDGFCAVALLDIVAAAVAKISVSE